MIWGVFFFSCNSFTCWNNPIEHTSGISSSYSAKASGYPQWRRGISQSLPSLFLVYGSVKVYWSSVFLAFWIFEKVVKTLLFKTLVGKMKICLAFTNMTYLKPMSSVWSFFFILLLANNRIFLYLCVWIYLTRTYYYDYLSLNRNLQENLKFL